EERARREVLLLGAHDVREAGQGVACLAEDIPLRLDGSLEAETLAPDGGGLTAHFLCRARDGRGQSLGECVLLGPRSDLLREFSPVAFHLNVVDVPVAHLFLLELSPSAENYH